MIQDLAGTGILVAAVSDGAGSASRSEHGADLVVASFLEAMATAIADDAGGLAFLDRGFVIRWLEDARTALAELAHREGCVVREYACTFLGAVVGDRSAGYVQIGDGAIVVVDEEDGNPNWVFWPQHGEFANSTFFITHDGAADIIQFRRADSVGGHGQIQEIALFTDGLERLVLDFAARAVHPPALKPIFLWLAGTEPSPMDSSSMGASSAALEAYLASGHVNRRTDDDKTLVMATRAPPGVGVIQPDGP